jgi:hypothetical protein
MADLLVRVAPPPTSLLQGLSVPPGIADVQRVNPEGPSDYNSAVPAKRVRFDLAVAVHEITPYAEIYGIHPREFVFGRGFYMIPATHSVFLPQPAVLGCLDDEEDEAEDSDEEF